jgi:uncharacterized membrane protein
VGWYSDAMFVMHAFLLSGGNVTTIDVPGALDTAASGINGLGQIVGGYHNSAGFHGFLATPIPEPTSAPLLALGLGGILILRKRFLHSGDLR